MKTALAQAGFASSDFGSGTPTIRSMKLLDNVERMLVLVFYLQMVVRMLWNAYEHANPASLILLPSEGLVVVLILLRRNANQLSLRWQDWLAAVFGTVLPTLVIATDKHPSTTILQAATVIALVGLIIQIHAKICLGLSFGIVAANRGIKSSGPYRLVRHPIYAGYVTAQVAFLAMFPTSWNAIVLGTAFLFQVYRIFVEERILSQDEQYVEYMNRVRYRIIPGVF